MKFNSPFESAAILYDAQQWGIEIMLYQSILHQGVKEIGQTPHFVTRGKPLVTHGEFIFRHYMVKNPIPFSPQ